MQKLTPVVLAFPLLLGAVPALAAAEPAPRVVAIVIDPRLDNASGLAQSSNGQLMFAVQDAGRSTLLFGLDKNGRTALTVPLPKGSNDDWEDVAVTALNGKRRVVVIADTGDAYQRRKAANLPTRSEYRLLRLDEPTGSGKPAGLVTYRFRYPDGRLRNVESLLVQPGSGQIYLVTKTNVPLPGASAEPSEDKDKQKAEVWQLPNPLSATALNDPKRIIEDFPVQGASGATFSPTGDRLVVRNADSAYLWWVDKGQVKESLAAEPIKVALPSQRQGEGVAFTRDGRNLLVNSEGLRAPIWEVSLPENARAQAAPRDPEPRTSGLGRKAPAAAIALLALLSSVAIIGFKIRNRVT